MPANLPPQYHEAQQRYREAKTPQEKIGFLEEMLAIIPKHKGTDKLQGDLKRRISKLKAEAQKKGPGGKRSYGFYVEKEGAGQAILLGPPNTGKSAIIGRLTHAAPEVAEYPFTTRTPIPGMMEYENVLIQLVDLPPVSPGFTESWLFNIVRNADAILMTVSLEEDPIEQLNTVEMELEKSKIAVAGITSGRRETGWVEKKAIIVANKGDKEGGGEQYALLKDAYGTTVPIVSVSARDGINFAELKEQIYRMLDIVRVYTKPPGKEPSFREPVILKRGSTLLEFAQSIHKDFAHKLKFARIWGAGKYQGQKVQKDYRVEEGDIIELHI